MSSEVATWLADVRTREVTVERRDDGRLVIGPRERVTEADLLFVAAHRADVVAALAPVREVEASAVVAPVSRRPRKPAATARREKAMDAGAPWPDGMDRGTAGRGLDPLTFWNPAAAARAACTPAHARGTSAQTALDRETSWRHATGRSGEPRRYAEPPEPDTADVMTHDRADGVDDDSGWNPPAA